MNRQAATPGPEPATTPRGRHGFCRGRVWHVRKAPFRHAFDYPQDMLELDLDDLPRAFAGHRGWSLDGPNLGSFRRHDHLDGSTDLAASARNAVVARLGFRPTGRVHLICHPRYFGYTFNPVTYYLLYDGAGDPADAAHPPSRAAHELAAILLEVSNTPWNERHLYAFDCRGRATPWTFEIDKAFHVSPFLPMDMRYRFTFDLTPGHFHVTKENLQGSASVFVARLELARAALTDRALTCALLRFPPMTFGVIGAIYWQALRLWWRGAHYHPKPPADTAREHHV